VINKLIKILCFEMLLMKELQLISFIKSNSQLVLLLICFDFYIIIHENSILIPSTVFPGYQDNFLKQSWPDNRTVPHIFAILICS